MTYFLLQKNCFCKRWRDSVFWTKLYRFPNDKKMVSSVPIICTILCSNLWFVRYHSSFCLNENMQAILCSILCSFYDIHECHTLVLTVFDIHATMRHHSLYMTYYFLLFVWWSTRAIISIGIIQAIWTNADILWNYNSVITIFCSMILKLHYSSLCLIRFWPNLAYSFLSM